MIIHPIIVIILTHFIWRTTSLRTEYIFHPKNVFIWQNEVGLLWLSLILEHRQGLYVWSTEAIAFVKANSTCSIWVKKETTPTMTKNRQTLSISLLWTTGSVIEKVCKHTESRAAHEFYSACMHIYSRVEKSSRDSCFIHCRPKNAHKSSSRYWHKSTFFQIIEGSIWAVQILL